MPYSTKYFLQLLLSCCLHGLLWPLVGQLRSLLALCSWLKLADDRLLLGHGEVSEPNNCPSSLSGSPSLWNHRKCKSREKYVHEGSFSIKCTPGDHLSFTKMREMCPFQRRKEGIV